MLKKKSIYILYLNASESLFSFLFSFKFQTGWLPQGNLTARTERVNYEEKVTVTSGVSFVLCSRCAHLSPTMQHKLSATHGAKWAMAKSELPKHCILKDKLHDSSINRTGQHLQQLLKVLKDQGKAVKMSTKRKLMMKIRLILNEWHCTSETKEHCHDGTKDNSQYIHCLTKSKMNKESLHKNLQHIGSSFVKTRTHTHTHTTKSYNQKP